MTYHTENGVTPVSALTTGISWCDRASRIAAEKVGFSPDEWTAWIFEKADQGGCYLTGAVCPPITRGKRKGQPNVRKADPKTRRKVYLTPEECT